ncbi:unnamed protein product [Rotaria sp. Silwood1]|nr:unnamed protein product [Rotaria sp. Silwood1]
MKANLFCLIFLIFCNEIHRLIALECYSCLSIKSNTTGCHDKFYYNETLISTTDLRNSDAICTKMIGKLADGTKFTFRNASSIGCPKDLENFIITISSMSFFQRLFGNSNKEDPNKITTHGAIQKLSDVEETLNKKQQYLESQIEIEKANALLNSKQGNKRAALMAMKQKKKHEKALIQIDGTLTTLEIQRETLQNASSTMEILRAMKQGANALEKANQHLNPDDIEKLKDKIAEELYIAEGIATAISTPPSGTSDLYNDADLERELNELAEQDTTDTYSLPNVPITNEVPSKSESVRKPEPLVSS